MPLIKLHRRPNPRVSEYGPDAILLNPEYIESVKGLLVGQERKLVSVVTMIGDPSSFVVVETVEHIEQLIKVAQP
jgi:hypothetical protein